MRHSVKRIGKGAMQHFAELHLKPETLARHDFSLGIALMIAGIAGESAGLINQFSSCFES